MLGGIYSIPFGDEVDKASGGSVTRTVTYYPVAGAMRIDSTLYYVLKDHLGSASVVTNASGLEVGTQRYYPFGETRLTTGTIYTDKLFTGQREMAGLGIYHYQARFYSPKLGRFLSADTIVPGYGDPQNLNRYSYVLGNPLRYVDPSGHIPIDCYNDPSYCSNTTTLPGAPSNGGGGGGGSSGNNGSQSGGGGNGGSNSNVPSGTPSGPTNTPTSTPCPSVVMTSCYPTTTSTPFPTVTPTATPSCNPAIANCIFPTTTPFLQEYVPVIEDAVGIANPLQVSYGPDVATLFWDTLLGASPILGIPATNLNQVITTDDRTNNGPRNAFQHAYWSATLARHFGSEFAESLTYNHEKNFDAIRETQFMDLHNNEVGRNIAENNPNISAGELVEKVYDAVLSGDMVVLNRENNKINIYFSNACPIGCVPP